MAIDTTDPSYWLNWRFLVCAIYVLVTMVFAAYLIWKHEGTKRLNDERRDRRQVPAGVLYKDEVWRTCFKGLHPAWLLGFRMFAFVLLLSLIISNTVADGPGIFYFYTQWTFALTTIYFGLASAFSLYGCWHENGGACHFKGASQIADVDAEQGSDVVPRLGGSDNTSLLKSLCNHEEVHVRQIAGYADYIFQIMYQVTAGAVVLTDVVFWLILYPFLTSKDFKLAFFDVSMHSLNVLVLGDTILNSMRFPMFRVSYFILWTSLFVICQWIIHVCVSMWWPYPFMDLSTPYAPIWYAAVGLLHIPCYGSFALIVKLKNLWLSRIYPETHHGMR